MTTPARAAASEMSRRRSRRDVSPSSTIKPSDMKKRTLRPGSGENPRTTDWSVSSVLAENLLA